MQNEPTSYFFSIAHSYSLNEIKRQYENIKHIETALEEIHNYLPYPAYFDEVIQLYLSSYNSSEYILEKLNIIEEIVLFTLTYFSEETVEIQNLLLDGFFTLHLFDLVQCKKIMKFMKELVADILYIKNLTIDELCKVYRIALYHSYYPGDKIRSFDSYRFSDENSIYMFDAQEFFLHLYIDQFNPVLLTDQFFSLKNSKDLEALHLLISGERELNTPTLQLDLNDQEFELLRSENHPPLTFNNRLPYGIGNALSCVKGLLSIQLPKEMIYRIFFDTDFSFLRISDELLITNINEYIEYLEREPTLREIYSLLKFQNDIPVDRKYPLFTSNEVRYLYKKEMSLYFKNNLSVFSEYCQFCQSLSGATTIHFEWMDLNKTPHFANYCEVCLSEKNDKYMVEFDCPF